MPFVGRAIKTVGFSTKNIGIRHDFLKFWAQLTAGASQSTVRLSVRGIRRSSYCSRYHPLFAGVTTKFMDKSQDHSTGDSNSRSASQLEPMNSEVPDDVTAKPELPPLTDNEFRTYNRMAVKMNYFVGALPHEVKYNV
jgi:hypothetical protein